MLSIDILPLADQISQDLIQRLGTLPLPPEELQENRMIIIEFNKIAANMLQGEQGLEIPGAAQPIPLDEGMAVQGLQLFSEGVYFAIQRCREKGVRADIKKNLLQNLALEIYNQCKQVVAATYRQEQTPDHQFTHAQQAQIIYKAIDGYISAYIVEYERANGPLPSPETLEETSLTPPPAENQPQNPPPQNQPTPQPPERQVAAQQPLALPPLPHEKYGALALLLKTISSKQRQRVLKGLTPEEKHLINFYSHPPNLEERLNLHQVQAHLKHFQEMFKQPQGASGKDTGSPILRPLAEADPHKVLLQFVQEERPKVREALMRCYQDHALYFETKDQDSAQENPLKVCRLPERIDGILKQYLEKQMG